MISKIKSFLRDECGVSAVEFAMILPVLLMLFLGVIDTGNALLVSKKTMTAAQIVADLMTRTRVVTNAQIEDSFAAARMAVQPFNTSSVGIDIVSIEFRGATATPTILWRETENMSENSNVLTLVQGLGVQGEGVVVVTTRYNFVPLFLNGVMDNINMQEVAITRGRRGPLVARES